MSDENSLLKTSFIDQLAQEKIDRQKLLALAKAKEEKDRKDLLCLASLERFLAKKLDFKGNMSDLRELDEREIANIKKLVLSDAKRKSLWSGFGSLVFLFSPYLILSLISPSYLALYPFLSFIAYFAAGVLSGTTLIAVFLRNFWFVITGHYLGSYCKECIKQRGTSRSCYCPPTSYDYL